MAGGTWIKLYSNVFVHKKTYILANKLKINEIYAAAHMIKLWTWAIDNVKDGDLSDIPYQLIAKAAEWLKNSELFVTSCISAGWLDRDESGKLLIHDWEDYTETLIRRRERDADRKRTERQKRTDVRKMSEGRPKDVHDPRVEESRVEESRVDSTTKVSPEDRGSKSHLQVESSSSATAYQEQPINPTIPVFQAYERDIGIPSGTVLDKLTKLVNQDGLSPGLIIAAISEAAECNKRSFRYVEGILNRCLSDGINTEGQFKAQKLQRSSTKNKTPDQSKTPAETDYSWGYSENDSRYPDFMKGGGDSDGHGNNSKAP